MWVKFDNDEFADLCVERLADVWHVAGTELDLWSDYYHDLFEEAYGDDDKLDESETIYSIVDNDYVNYMSVVTEEQLLSEYRFDSLEDAYDAGVIAAEGENGDGERIFLIRP